MKANAWDSYKVREFTKMDIKILNKAVRLLSNDDAGLKYRDQLKWSVIAILDELEEIKDVYKGAITQIEFDRNFKDKRKENTKALAPAPDIKTPPCTVIEKDSTFKLM